MKRKKMKVNILSLLGLAAMLFTACATDDVAHDRQNQKQKSDGEGLTAFSVNNETPPTNPTTRTAGEYTGTGVKFYWTKYDKLSGMIGTTLKNSSRPRVKTAHPEPNSGFLANTPLHSILYVM